MQRQYDDLIEFDLKELFFVFLGEIKIIFLSAVIMAMTVFVFNKFVLTPQYSSTSQLYILPKSASLTSVADLQIGTNLTQDYMVIVKGRSVVEGVIKNMNLKETYESLRSRVSVQNPIDTRILNITITHPDPELAKEIADEFASVAAKYISEKMDQEPPNIIEKGVVSKKPVGPRTKRNTLFGFLAGFVLMGGFVMVIHLLDDTLKNEDEIEKYLDLNTLASIPASISVNRSAKEKAKERKNAMKVLKKRALKQKKEVKKK